MENNILIPESLYDRLVEYFDDKSDADGDSQGIYPNKEMTLLTELENCLIK
jgi:hypothetical protein